MEVYLNRIEGVADAIVSLYMSKRTWTKGIELQIRHTCDAVSDKDGMIDRRRPGYRDFTKLIEKIVKFGPQHTTLLRYIDFSFTVEGLHRGAQDDFDSHAKRLENRIIRSSTRLATFGCEVSDYYKNKILTTDQALDILGITIPEKILVPTVTGNMMGGTEDISFVRAVNGYIREDLAEENDVKRGLYMLSIPSNFIFKVNCAEFAHILKQRDKNSHAHPELQEAVEKMLQAINAQYEWFTRDFFYSIQN